MSRPELKNNLERLRLHQCNFTAGDYNEGRRCRDVLRTILDDVEPEDLDVVLGLVELEEQLPPVQ